MNCDEKVRRLEAALARSVAESYKRELLAIVGPAGPLDDFGEKIRRNRNRIGGLDDLSMFMDTNMVPPEAEWLLGEPLVVASEQEAGDYEGQQLAVNVFNQMQGLVDHWLREGGLRVPAGKEATDVVLP